MKVAWIALATFAGSLVCLGVGCGDEGTSTSGGSSSSSSGGESSSSSGSSGASSSGASSSGASSSGASSSGSTSSSSSSGASGGFADCASCTTNDGTGAYDTTCKTQTDACNADTQCAALLTYAYDNCGYDGCCPLKKAMADNLPAASVNLYKAVENCATCGACKALCADVGADAFCAKLNEANPVCP